MKCESCGAELVNCGANRRFCDACGEERKRQRGRAYYQRAVSKGIKAGCRCRICGAEVAGRRWYCDACRETREAEVKELRRIQTAEARAADKLWETVQTREKAKTSRLKDPLEGWSAREIAMLGERWGLSYGYTVVKARETPEKELERLRKDMHI